MKGDDVPPAADTAAVAGPPFLSPAWLKGAIIGDYDYRYLCTPKWPYPWMCGSKEVGREPPTFFPLDEKMAFIPAMILGLQHCLAMLIGLITPAQIMGGSTDDPKTKLYLINASMIVAGIMTIVQSVGIKHPKLGFQWGAGTLSVMGVSFTTMPIAQAVVPTLMREYATLNHCGLKYDFFAVGNSAAGSPCAAAAVGFQPYGPHGKSCIPYCVNQAFDYAWGKMLGTLAFCALIPMFVSMMPYKRINMLFPPVVIGPVIMLIGIALIGVGFGDWGGGTYCGQRVIYNGFSNNMMSAVVTNDGDYGFVSSDGIDNPLQHASEHAVTLTAKDFIGGVTASYPGQSFGAPGAPIASVTAMVNTTVFANTTLANGTVVSNTSQPVGWKIVPTIINASSIMVPNYVGALGSQGGYNSGFAKTGTGFFTGFTCNEASKVFDVYGSAEYVGLGFLTFTTIMAVEIFGSPFMRNCSCVIGLLWGYSAATWSRHGGQKYVTNDAMNAAPGITFLWTKSPFFKIDFYPPLIIPFFIVFIITTTETWGDTQASMEASRLDVSGKPLQIMRQKGALLNDTLSGILAALAGVLPLTTFAQNNGIISLTAVASRRVGVACGVWLITMGILSKIGAFIMTIPGPVLGGMTTFLFANVMASGMHILLSDPGGLKRRNRFICAAAFGCGVGVTLWPAWAENHLWPIDGHMRDGSNLGKAKLGVRQAIILILQTGFCFGFVVAFTMNMLLPVDREDGKEHTVHGHEHTKPPEESMHVHVEPV